MASVDEFRPASTACDDHTVLDRRTLRGDRGVGKSTPYSRVCASITASLGEIWDRWLDAR